MITTFDLPEELEVRLTLFAEQVLENPNRFILGNDLYLPSAKPHIDENNPILPGVHPHFMKTRDPANQTWKTHNDLQTCALKWLYDLSFPPAPETIELFQFLEMKTGKRITAHRGNFFYPQNGFMGWHTNSDVPGTRVYIAYSQKNDGSYFRYIDFSNIAEPKVITDWDKKGWTVRMFHPTNDTENLLWHCVNAPHADRMSFGFLLV